MMYHRGVEFQRGGGVGSILSGLVKRLVPIAEKKLFHWKADYEK